MKVLVTGAAGFIGMHVARRLLERGDTVVGLDNLNDYYDVNLKLARLKQLELPGFSFHKLDVADGADIDQLFAAEKFDRVVHLAAQAGVRYSLINPHEYVRSNITGFLNILEACRHHPVEHLVYASSSSVYGGNTRLPFKESDNVDHPVSLYAASKKSNELMAHTYSHLFGIPTTGLRFFTVYGPWGRPDMALFLFTKAILAGEPVNVFNHGKMQRDFTYIDDIVEGVVRVLDRAPVADPAFDTASTGSGALVGAVPGAQHRQSRSGWTAGVPRRARGSAGQEGRAESTCRCSPAMFRRRLRIRRCSPNGQGTSRGRRYKRGSSDSCDGTLSTTKPLRKSTSVVGRHFEGNCPKRTNVSGLRFAPSSFKHQSETSSGRCRLLEKPVDVLEVNDRSIFSDQRHPVTAREYRHEHRALLYFSDVGESLTYGFGPVGILLQQNG